MYNKKNQNYSQTLYHTGGTTETSSNLSPGSPAGRAAVATTTAGGRPEATVATTTTPRLRPNPRPPQPPGSTSPVRPSLRRRNAPQMRRSRRSTSRAQNLVTRSRCRETRGSRRRKGLRRRKGVQGRISA